MAYLIFGRTFLKYLYSKKEVNQKAFRKERFPGTTNRRNDHIPKNLKKKKLIFSSLIWWIYYFFFITVPLFSGARYSGVPQKVLVVSVPKSPSFDSPKSVRTTWPEKKKLWESILSNEGQRVQEKNGLGKNYLQLKFCNLDDEFFFFFLLCKWQWPLKKKVFNDQIHFFKRFFYSRGNCMGFYNRQGWYVWMYIWDIDSQNWKFMSLSKTKNG